MEVAKVPDVWQVEMLEQLKIYNPDADVFPDDPKSVMGALLGGVHRLQDTVTARMILQQQLIDIHEAAGKLAKVRPWFFGRKVWQVYVDELQLIRIKVERSLHNLDNPGNEY